MAIFNSYVSHYQRVISDLRWTPDELGLGHLGVSLPSPKSPVANITVRGRIKKSWFPMGSSGALHMTTLTHHLLHRWNDPQICWWVKNGWPCFCLRVENRPSVLGFFTHVPWGGVGWGNNVHVLAHSHDVTPRHVHLHVRTYVMLRWRCVTSRRGGVGWGNNVHVLASVPDQLTSCPQNEQKLNDLIWTYVRTWQWRWEANVVGKALLEKTGAYLAKMSPEKMAAAEVLGTLTSQKEPFSHSDMSTIYSKSQWKFNITIELTFMDNIKNMKKHCETHDWLLASHMKMLFLLGPFPTRRVVSPSCAQL